ncbi:MAG TPA: biotin carboxylase N-terminal domain-containing protein [Rhodoferax sp.]
MKIKKLPIANRGEIAIRIARAAFELGMTTVALFSEDDATSLHCRKTDEACALKGSGAAAYLAIEQILSIACATGCDAIHPGYGFLSENAQFAARCAEQDIIFVGPTAEVLKLFGDKVQARNLAQRTQVPVVLGTQGATSLLEAHAFFASLGDGGAMMIKAISGGGGRGMRAVYARDQIDAAYERCQSEAQASFNSREVYVEELVLNARHVEIQVIRDGSGRTPGFMVGPDAEKSAMVRHVSRIFVAAASITVPLFMIVLRKGYGLGSIAMAGGSFHATFFTVSWPCGEFGAMGIDGAANLGYRKELEVVIDPVQRQALFEKLVSAAYEKGKAISMASYLEFDDVIDPAESRKWIVRGLRSLPAALPREGKKRNFVDTW